MRESVPTGDEEDAARGQAASLHIRHVILIGLPGVGKTTVGRSVARRLGRPFVDMDDEIERLFEKTVSRIFSEDGEPVFRSGEAAVSKRLASSTEPSVISPGGGWVSNEAARAHLRGAARIIYLRVSPDEAVRRMGRGIAKRPLLSSGDPVSALQALHERRREAYEALADLTVETTGITRGQVAARVLQVVHAAERNYSDGD